MLTAIKRQAVGFRPETPNNYDNADLCQLVNRTDSTQFQIQNTPLDGVDLITDGEFNSACGVNWSCGGSWNIAGNKAEIDQGGGTSVINQSISELLPNTFYRVKVTVSDYVIGTLEIEILGNFSPVSISENGSKTLYFFSGNSGSTIFFEATGLTEMKITNVELVQMSSVGYRILDLNGGLIFDDSDGTTVQSNQNSAFQLIDIDWTNAPVDDCYELCLIDTAKTNLVVNGSFTGGGANWDVSGSSAWSFSGDVAVGDSTAGGLPVVDRDLKQVLTLLELKKYSVTYRIFNFVQGSVKAFTDDFSLTVRSANGIFTEIIDLTLGGDDQTFIGFQLADNSDLQIDDVVIFELNETKDCVLTSECFKLLDNHVDSLLITATNDNNAFQLDYNNFPNFIQSFRQQAEVHLLDYEVSNNITWRDSRNNLLRIRGNSIRRDRLHMTLMKDYNHDFMHVALLSDDFLIDGVKFTYEENTYLPQKTLDTNLSVSDAVVINEDQNFQNNNC